MKILLVYPENPDTFWNFQYALKFSNRKATYPPLGLLTIAALLPQEWEKKFIDMNIDSLEDDHLQWADYVFLSATDIQQKSAGEVIRRCNKSGVKVIAGGPFFTHAYLQPDNFENVDHLVLGEAESTLPAFLHDLKHATPKHAYVQGDWPPMENSPPPLWDIVPLYKYAAVGIQYSRGCPFDCDFCQISNFFGRKVRTKSKDQLIRELESLYTLGWRGNVFFVDDNFIGNKHKLKTEILPAIIDWLREKNYPFTFYTQSSINLADDEELMHMMGLGSFTGVFVGIESVDEGCLAEANKPLNRGRDMIADVKKMQRFGLEVWGGFIVGFDRDQPSIFDRIIKFIQESGVTIAMVGLLRANKGTRLYARLKQEKRLLCDDTGNNTDFTLTHVPKMEKEALLQGYRKIFQEIYAPRPYLGRILTFLKEYEPADIGVMGYNISYFTPKNIVSSLKSIIKIMLILGIFEQGRLYYWKLFFWSLFKRPILFARALNLWIEGYHCRKVFGT